MDNLFENATVVAALISGLGSVAAALFTFVAGSLAQKRKLRHAERENVLSVLAQDDINRLGAYVDNVIGAFTMKEYASNSEVQDRVDAYVDRIQEYLGAPEDIQQERGIREPDRPIHMHDVELPDDFQPILRELRYGELWNALARLRRHLEVTLKQKASQAGIPIEKVLSIGRLLNLLEKRQVIAPGTANSLRYPISLSNKAVHGEDVSMAEAEEAVFHAARILQSLDV